jgi:hypothetical protein
MFAIVLAAQFLLHARPSQIGTKVQGEHESSDAKLPMGRLLTDAERESVYAAGGALTDRPGKALVTLTVGKAHLENAEAIVARFGCSRFDFVIFHWEEAPPWLEEATGGHLAIGAAEAAGCLTHRHRYKWLKLRFAREFLTPDYLRKYSHVFLWDGDVQLAPSFDPV